VKESASWRLREEMDTHAIRLTKGAENITWWKVRAPTYSNAISWPLMFRARNWPMHP
jgi:hypothetical protein